MYVIPSEWIYGFMCEMDVINLQRLECIPSQVLKITGAPSSSDASMTSHTTAYIPHKSDDAYEVYRPDSP